METRDADRRRRGAGRPEGADARRERAGTCPFETSRFTRFGAHCSERGEESWSVFTEESWGAGNFDDVRRSFAERASVPPATAVQNGSSMMTPDDKALIEAFQAGDEFAFVSLYNRYKGPVYAFCVKMLLDRAPAQDVMQETFLRVYENRDRLHSTSSFKSWLFTIARNQCLNQLRRSNRQVPLGEGEDTPEVFFDTPVFNLEKSERIELVSHFLAQLKPDYREVLILREYHNLSYEEIAAITRSTLSAVKSRLFKARRRLADFLEPLMRNEKTSFNVE